MIARPTAPIVPPLEAEGDLVSFLAERRPAPGRLYRALVLLLFAGAITLPLIMVPVTVRSAGLLRPVAEKVEVRTRASGTIRRVTVRAGQSVRAGEVVAELDSSGGDVRRTEVDAQLVLREREEADLRRLIDAAGSGRLDAAAPALPRFQQALARLAAELREAGLTEAHLRKEAERAEALIAMRMTSDSAVEGARFAIEQATARRQALVQRSLAEWHGELASVERERRTLLAERGQLATESGQRVIVAPATGTLDELTGLVPGAVVGAGERLAIVSPDTTLRAEIIVSTRDVGLLRVGMPVLLQVDAFPFTTWGSVRGTVAAMSNDFVAVNGTPTFRVICQLERTALQLANGARGTLRKGMTVQARFVVAERSLWRLLFDDLGDWLDPRRADATSGEVTS